MKLSIKYKVGKWSKRSFHCIENKYTCVYIYQHNQLNFCYHASLVMFVIFYREVH